MISLRHDFGIDVNIYRKVRLFLLDISHILHSWSTSTAVKEVIDEARHKADRYANEWQVKVQFNIEHPL